MHYLWAWLLFPLAHLWKVSKTTIHHQCLPILVSTLTVFDWLLPCRLSNREVPNWLTQIPIILIFFAYTTLSNQETSRQDTLSNYILDHMGSLSFLLLKFQFLVKKYLHSLLVCWSLWNPLATLMAFQMILSLLGF